MKGRKTGGRQKGTPNKENPLKGYLRTHSLMYFQPHEQIDDKGQPIILPNGEPLTDGNGKPVVASDFDVDMRLLSPSDRVSAEIKILEYHQPKMKSVDVDMSVKGTVTTIEDQLRELCGEEN